MGVVYTLKLPHALNICSLQVKLGMFEDRITDSYTLDNNTINIKQEFTLNQSLLLGINFYSQKIVLV